MNYATGDRWEKVVAETFEAEGYVVWQARGSKGAADLIAAKPGQLVLVQVKRLAIAEPVPAQIIGHGGWNGLWDLARYLRAVPVIADVTGTRNTKGVLRLREITGPHIARTQHWPARPFVLDQVNGQVHD